MDFTERHETALRQRTVEMFGLPGDLCPNPACRRKGRCLSTAQKEPECLRLLDVNARKFYARLIDHCQWADRDKIRFLGCYIGGVRDDAFLMLVGEIVRRVQPRGHFLHAALPRWYRLTTRKSGRATVCLRAAMDTPRRYY